MNNTHHTNPNNPAPVTAQTAGVQLLDTNADQAAHTTETVARRRTPGLWIGAAGLMIGFGISQLSIIGGGAVAQPSVAEAAISESIVAPAESAWTLADSTNQQELNRARALADLTPAPTFTSHDVAEARRMHTLREVFGTDSHNCNIEE